jgi:outer membrane protein assembly factor BamB
MQEALIEPENIEWHWDDSIPSGYVNIAGGRITFSATDGLHCRVMRIDPMGERIWRQAIEGIGVDSSAIIIHDDLVYVAIYNRSATGAQVIALDVESGVKVWETALEGLGSIGHSKYSNRVQIQIIDDQLVIFGDESRGKYIEVLDSRDGLLIHNRKVQI